MNTLPTVGTWYENDEGDISVVVAVHADRGTIEVRSQQIGRRH
jgi:hypothetical protein